MDEAGYREKEHRQMRPGMYHVRASDLLPEHRNIMPDSVRIRSQITGSFVDSKSLPVNAESDLRGLGRPITRAPANYTQMRGGSNSGHHVQAREQEYVQTRDVSHLRTLDSRLDMPALALRGATPNRFHPHLLHDPADFAFAPFDRLVSSRIVMKDQWRVPQSSLNSVRPPTIPGRMKQKSAY